MLLGNFMNGLTELYCAWNIVWGQILYFINILFDHVKLFWKTNYEKLTFFLSVEQEESLCNEKGVSSAEKEYAQ